MKKSDKFPLTMFGALVLIIVLALLFQVWRGKAEPIFDNNTTTTWYAKTSVGTVPKLDPEHYFSSDTYDCTKFEFDLKPYNWNKPGIYRVPVLYDGKKTNCVVQVEVQPLENKEQGTAPNMNENTVMTGSK